MDLSRGKFIDDAEETILVKDKVVNGYSSDNAEVAKIRYSRADTDNLKKSQEEETSSFVSTALKGVGNAFGMAVDAFIPWETPAQAVKSVGYAIPSLASSMYSGAEAYGANIAKDVMTLKSANEKGWWNVITGETPILTDEEEKKYDDMLRGAVTEIKKRTDEFNTEAARAMGIEEDSVASFIGQAVGSVGASVGLWWLTRNPSMVAALFSLPTYYGIMESASENEDVKMSDAHWAGVGAGAAVSFLEEFGLQKLIESIGVKTIFGAMAKSAVSEGVTEGLQQIAEDIPMVFMTKDKKFVGEDGKIIWKNVAQDIVMAMVGGAIGGGFSAGVMNVASMVSQKTQIPPEDIANQLNIGGSNVKENVGGGNGPEPPGGGSGEGPTPSGGKVRKEPEQEVVEAIADKFVESGKYTREQADQIVAALSGKTEVTSELEKIAPGVKDVAKIIKTARQDVLDPKYMKEKLAHEIYTLLDPANLPEQSLQGLFKAINEEKVAYVDPLLAEKAKEERLKRDISDMVDVKDLSPSERTAVTTATQAFADAEAAVFGRTQREVMSPLTVKDLAGERTQEVLDKINSGDMSESEKRASYAALAMERGEEIVMDGVTFYPNGTYDDGEHVYDAKGNMLFQFIGEKIAQRSPELVGRLNTAKERIANGENPETVRKETGWYQWVDGGWRFEISDNMAKFKSNDDIRKTQTKSVDEKGNPIFLIKLGDLIEHEVLFNAYPEAKDMQVIISEEKQAKKYEEYGHLGEYNGEPAIYLYSKALKNKKRAMGTILHEMQHHIQNIEGFAKGGNPIMFATKEQLQEDLSEQKERLNMANEAIERGEDLGYSDDTLIDGTPLKEYKEIKESAEKRIDEITEELDNYTSPYKRYYRLGGEVEARNVTKRMDLTEEQRLEKSPLKTQSVPSRKIGVWFQQDKGHVPGAFFDINEDGRALIGKLSKGDISSLPHEMTHYFTNQHVLNCIKYGKFDTIQDVMKYFGVTDPMMLIENEDIQERLARMSIKYVQENEAPTAGLRRYFEIFKRFGRKLVSSWKANGIIDEEELPTEVRDFFDSLLGTKQKEKVDVESIKQQRQDIIDSLKKLKAGEAVDINGLPIRETRELMKAMNMRIPRAPQNLKTALINAGGISTDFAQQFDLQQLSGQEKDYRLFKKNGLIDSEDSLIDFLTSEGFLRQEYGDSYEDTSMKWEDAMNAIENMEETYRFDDEQKLLERERAQTLAEEAGRIINAIGAEDAFDVIELIDSLKGRVVAEEEYINSLERKVKRLDKDYQRLYEQLLKDQAREFSEKAREEIKQAKGEIKQMRDDVIDFIKAQDLELKDKAKLISLIKRANTKASFEKVINEVNRRSKDMYRKEQVRVLSGLIQKEVATRKPALKEQKYAYEENKLFQDLREWNKLNQTDAGIRYQAYSTDPEFMDNLTREDEIRLLFLQHKALGANSSPELLSTLLNYIEMAKRVGRQAKNEAEYEKAMSLDNVKEDMLNNLETRKGKPTIYIKWVSNLYSSLYTIFGKNVADKFELETVQNRAAIKASKDIDAVVKPVMKAYNAKSKADFLNVLARLAEQTESITTVSDNLDTPLSKRGVTHKLSRLDIIDIYNAIKNEKTRDDYYYWYGKDQIDRLVGQLTQSDMLFGDLMMEAVNARYDAVNAAYIRNFYTDLPKVDNYWMATSEHKEDLTPLDFHGDYASQSPSFTKERVKGRVLPKPGNAYQKFVKHIQGTYWFTDIADTQVQLANALKSIRVKNAIENKLGIDTYNALMKQVEMVSYSGLMHDVDWMSGIVDSIINNATVAKISLALPVLSGQLSSVGLYAENMKTSDWVKGFFYALSHPVEAYKFMKQNVGDFLEARYSGGYDETINLLLREATSGKKKYGLSSGGKYNLMQALTSFVRTGDVGAIIFGGYPRLKQLLETMPREQAIKQWEFETLRSQQSGVTASKSPFQQQKGWNRLFTAFKNFQFQANRKIVDSVYGYMNGEVTAGQVGKEVALYAVYASVAYSVFKMAANALLFGEIPDDWEESIAENVAMQEASIIPVVSDVMNYALRRWHGKYAKTGMSLLAIDDLFTSVNKAFKQNKNAYDYAEIVVPFIEMMTAVPAQRTLRTIKKWNPPEKTTKSKKKVEKKK